MKLKDVFDWFIPDFISDLFKKEEGWKHKGTIGVKQYAEHIHADNDEPFANKRTKDGHNDDIRFIDMTSVRIKNRYEKDNVVKFDEKGNFGINAAVETDVGIGLYRGDFTGDKKGTKPHDFANVVFPFVHAGVGGEATVAYNGNDKFKPEVGVRSNVEFQGRIHNQTEAIVKVSSQITDKDKIGAYVTHTLHEGAYYPIAIGGMEKGYNPYGKGNEVGISYERKLDGGNSIEFDAFYRKVQASEVNNNNSFEHDNTTIGANISFRY